MKGVGCNVQSMSNSYKQKQYVTVKREHYKIKDKGMKAGRREISSPVLSGAKEVYRMAKQMGRYFTSQHEDNTMRTEKDCEVKGKLDMGGYTGQNSRDMENGKTQKRKWRQK